MAIDFRCEKCGKLLSVADPQQDAVTCPQCGAQATVPLALAALPRPHVRPNAPVQPTAKAPSARAQGKDGQELVAEKDSQLMTVMSTAMPWVFSLFLHMGVFLIMTFGVLVVIKQSDAPANEIVVMGDMDNMAADGKPGGQLNPGEAASELFARQNERPSESKGYARHENTINGPDGIEKNNGPSMIGIGGGGAGGAMAAFGADNRGGGSEHGPRSEFIGFGGNAHHVVWVIDRSGSMLGEGVFDHVKLEMAHSIGLLGEEAEKAQDFHIVMFAASDAKPVEFGPKRLVPATFEMKTAAAKFLEGVRTHEKAGTDPVPALRRAFSVLAGADQLKKGKIIYLLTDGRFDDNGAVLTAIRDLNKDKSVAIFTYLYGTLDVEAARVMELIAKENNGRFKQIDRDQ
jgi:hypothetical protein